MKDVPVRNKFYSYVTIKKNRLPRQIFEHFWLNFILPKYISKLKIDLFFTPYIFVPLRKRNWKNVIVIADSLTKTCKEYYSYHYRKYMDFLVPPSIKRSDAIVTISNSAKQDIVKFYKISADRIRVMHLWTDDKYKSLNISENEKKNLLLKFNLPEKFVLFVSVLEERKNIAAIIKVSDILVSRGIDIKFVLVGREGFGFKKIETELKKRNKNILHLRFVADEDLLLLYNLSTVFFFPTHYEGFGLPPLEAMKCGIPVVTSNNSSLPEVVGDGGILGDANDYEFFASSIVKLVSDEKHYIEIKQKGIKQSENFAAEHQVKKLIDIFNSFDGKR